MRERHRERDVERERGKKRKREWEKESEREREWKRKRVKEKEREREKERDRSFLYQSPGGFERASLVRLRSSLLMLRAKSTNQQVSLSGILWKKMISKVSLFRYASFELITCHECWRNALIIFNINFVLQHQNLHVITFMNNSAV